MSRPSSHQSPGVLRRAWNYESSVARCGNCMNFRESRVVLTNDSVTRRINHHCGSGGFTCTPNGCCDKWIGKDGATADPAPEVKVINHHHHQYTRVYDCMNCGKEFKSREARDQHVRDTHPPAWAKKAQG